MDTAKQYRLSLTAIAAIAAAGFLLQLAAGPVDMTLLAFPVNAIVAALIVLAVVLLALYREKRAFRLLSDVPFSVCAMAALLVLYVTMGLIPQSPAGTVDNGFASRAGIDSMASSWPFALLYITLLLSLGCVVARALMNFNARRWAFYFNHIGLWLVFVGVGLGGADMRELTAKIEEGTTAHHWAGRFGMPEKMPFELRLDDFEMDEYPARWGIVDIRTGRFQPVKKPRFYASEEEAFARNPSPGPHERVASARPEPRRFASHVSVTDGGGTTRQAVIEVNRPFRRGGWAVYQSGYDTEAGPESTWSVLKAVRDPWLPVVYTGVAMLAAGAVSMMLKRRKR